MSGSSKTCVSISFSLLFFTFDNFGDMANPWLLKLLSLLKYFEYSFPLGHFFAPSFVKYISCKTNITIILGYLLPIHKFIHILYVTVLILITFISVVKVLTMVSAMLFANATVIG